MDDQPSSDALLWRQATAGDERAFGELFVRHVQRVYNYCFRRLGSWSVAEDATQLVFMHIWAKRDVVLVEDSILPFLFAVANNVSRNVSRSARRYTIASAVPPPPPVGDFADDVAKRIDDERQMQRVLEAMRRMRRIDRDVVAMCDWEGLSYVDVANALKVPVGTVKSRLSRARQRLRDSLADVARVVQPNPASGREWAPSESEGELP